jgi:hydrogenase/urease accessory protein HupE
MTDIAPAIFYFLCLAASTLCAVLLVRSWRRTRSNLLLWTALCFVFLAVNNLLLVIDLIFLPQVDLTFYRQAALLGALVVLLYGFIKEAA